jgi:zinc transport system ATP-binding protein
MIQKTQPTPPTIQPDCLLASPSKNTVKACGFHCIKIKNLGVTLDSSLILNDVNLHIHCGRLISVIGKNGAGKSTLIKAILGEIPHSGTIEFRDIRQGMNSRLRIGYVPQHLNIEKNSPTSVYDLFASFISRVPVFLFRKKSVEDKIKKQLAMFQAEDLINKRVCDLSGGQLQRVLLSIAVCPLPNLLLLDEPVSGIDQAGMDAFYQTIHALKTNYDLSILMVSHDLEYVRKYSDQVVLLDKTILKQGAPEEIFESSEYKSVFQNNYKK